MSAPSKNRTKPRRPSNGRHGETWLHLASACRTAAETRNGPETIRRLLLQAVLATGAERAFLLAAADSGGEEPGILSSLSLRSDGREQPSRSAARFALGCESPRISTDLHRFGTPAAEGNSVRSLDLRTVMSAPVRNPGVGRGCLLLDTRNLVADTGSRVTGLLDAFGALLSLHRWIPERAAPETSEEGLAGRSPGFLSLLSDARKAARCDLPVLVEGETGTGKEKIARYIHRVGRRRSGPFRAINCAAVPETLVESELFGTVRGSYTGATRDTPGLFRMADGGTLLLDEIGDMPLTMQAKLLRVLQQRTVRPVGGSDELPADVRIISASHRDLRALVEQGSFRLDLYYRLAVVELAVPPLRSRIDDLPVLTEYLCERLERESGLCRASITPEALGVLESYRWPGNIRELESVLARAGLRAGGAPIEPGHIDLPAPPSAPFPPDADDEPLERSMIRFALRENCGSLAGAARQIGWTRQKLYRRIKEYGLSR